MLFMKETVVSASALVQQTYASVRSNLTSIIIVTTVEQSIDQYYHTTGA